MTAVVTDIVRGTSVTTVALGTPVVDLTTQQLRLAVDDPAAFARAGDYTVSLLLTAANDRQQLVLTLVRPTAVVAAGGTVHVEQVVGWLSCFNQDHYPQLNLTLDPDGSQLITLSAQQIDRAQGEVILT